MKNKNGSVNVNHSKTKYSLLQSLVQEIELDYFILKFLKDQHHSLIDVI